MPQFLISPEDISQNSFVIKGKEARHLIKVLRVKVKEKIRLFDGHGKCYLGETTFINKNKVRGKIISVIADSSVLSLRASAKQSINVVADSSKKIFLRLFPALIKSDRFELLLEKVTEIGVDEIVPIITERTIIKIPEEKISSKITRWKKKLVSASKQCNLTDIPGLGNITSLIEVLEKLPGQNELNLIAWEGNIPTQNLVVPSLRALSLRSGQAPRNNLTSSVPLTINLFIGPEGGFTEKEINSAKSRQVIPFSLGKNILRAETAAISACAIILYEFNK